MSQFDVPSRADSPAGASFFEQHYRDLAWATGQEVIVRELEELVKTVTDAIRESSRPSNMEVKQYQEAARLAARSMEHRAAVARRLVAQSAATAHEAILCRYVDNFLSYLVDLLGQIFRKYPDRLTSSETRMSVSEVFRHESMDELLLSLIDKRINELSFEGLATIEEYYRKSFGLELVPHAQNRQLLMLAIASRNLLVHRRGVIDERYIRATASIERKGTRLRIARLVWPELIPVLLETVRDIDCRAAQKFGFQSALVISGNEVASMQEAFFDSVKREVLEWRT